MKTEFQKAIDIAINESNNPIIIIGNPTDGKVNYLNENYITFFISPNEYINAIENHWIKTFLLLTKKSFDKKFESEENKKILFVFDGLDKVSPEIFSEFAFAFKAGSSKPAFLENSLIIGLANNGHEFSKMINEYANYFTIVNGSNENNVQIDFGSKPKTK